jgi:hypothetical protein
VSFRKQHEQLRNVIVRVVKPGADGEASPDDRRILEDVDAAYDVRVCSPLICLARIGTPVASRTSVSFSCIRLVLLSDVLQEMKVDVLDMTVTGNAKYEKARCAICPPECSHSFAPSSEFSGAHLLSSSTPDLQSV